MSLLLFCLVVLLIVVIIIYLISLVGLPSQIAMVCKGIVVLIAIVVIFQQLNIDV